MTNSRRQFFQTLTSAALASQWRPAIAAEHAKQNMIVRSTRPEDFEMPLDGFSDWITPIDRFYVRSHHYTPAVSLDTWKLTVDGEVDKPVTLTMADLKKLPRVEMVAVMECAGNGRSLYEPPVPGAQWVYGSVGNGRWAGVRMADVLAKAGVKASAQHILMDGADVPVGIMPEFKRTIPVKKALHRDTLLAYEMNGEALPASHGFPLRVIVPGWAGDSWVKWLTGLTVLDKEFDGFWMKTAYRHPGNPVVPGSAVDPAKMHSVESISIKSVIAGPLDQMKVAPGPVRIHGTAWSNETPVASVEVSVDRGRTWQKAKLNSEQARYGWRLFEYTWTPREPGYYVVMARAFDTAGKTQPMVQEWNPSGYLFNAVQKVAVEVTTDPISAAEPAGAQPGSTPKEFEAPNGFKSSCLPCHQEDIIMQQRLTRVQWEREVDKMVRWGAKVDSADRGPIVDYLLRLYGPRPRK
jgi:sulfite oxidase